MSLDGARILLLQARLHTDPMAPHEHQCFADALRVPRAQITVHDGILSPPDASVLARHDMMVIGGSGDFSVTDGEAWLPPFFTFLRDVVVERRFPTFGSCFGFQALVVAGGGEVITDLDRSEIGTFDVDVTPAGQDDPLFAALSPRFTVQLGHKDRATGLPAGYVHVASTERCPYQAFRLRGSHVVATQFHPELSRAATITRYKHYLSLYQLNPPAPGERDPVIDGFRDSDDATDLLPRWADEVLSARVR